MSERQWNNALGVMRVQRPLLDYKYLRRAAKQKHVSDLWKRMLDEAGIRELGPSTS